MPNEFYAVEFPGDSFYFFKVKIRFLSSYGKSF